MKHNPVRKVLNFQPKPKVSIHKSVSLELFLATVDFGCNDNEGITPISLLYLEAVTGKGQEV